MVKHHLYYVQPFHWQEFVWFANICCWFYSLYENIYTFVLHVDNMKNTTHGCVRELTTKLTRWRNSGFICSTCLLMPMLLKLLMCYCWGCRAHTSPGHRLEDFFDFGIAFSKRMPPKGVLWILDEFNECHQKTPRMWTMHDQSLKQDSGDLFLQKLFLGLWEK